VNYREQFQLSIVALQRALDSSMQKGEWGRYLELRHRMIAVKEHIVAHEAECGYHCACKAEERWLKHAEV